MCWKTKIDIVGDLDQGDMFAHDINLNQSNLPGCSGWHDLK